MFIRFSEKFRSPVADILIGKSVKADLSPAVGFRILPRDGVGGEVFAHLCMESGVEDRVLRDLRQPFPADLDHAVGIRVVDRRQGQAFPQLGERCIIQQG